jgi:phosphoserine phosphatase
MTDIDRGSWNADAFALLTQRVLAGPPGLAAFDFDNTLIRNDLGEAVMYYIIFQALLRADLDPFWEEIRHPAIPDALLEQLRAVWRGIEAQGDSDNVEDYMAFVDRLTPLYGMVYEQAGMAEAYRWSRVLFAFQTAQELRSITKYVFAYEQNQPLGESRLPSGLVIPRGIRVHGEVEQLIRAMLARGWDVRIVTASPEIIIQTVIERWGIDPGQVHGMRLERDDQDLLLPRIREPMPVQAGKVDMIRSESDRPLDFMMGDSIGDLELLQHARTGILIDRGNADLRAAAEASGILVQPPFAVSAGAPPGAADLPWP